MDQFEAARLKTAQREARKARYAEESSPENPPENPGELSTLQPIPKVPKGKPFKNGVFTISVDMPHKRFTFTLVKESILSHAPANRLTESEIRRHIIQGLKPLLGGIE